MHSKHSKDTATPSPGESETGRKQHGDNQNRASISLRKYFAFFPSTLALGRDRETQANSLPALTSLATEPGVPMPPARESLLFQLTGTRVTGLSFQHLENMCGFELRFSAGTPKSLMPNSKKNVAKAFIFSSHGLK